MQGPVLLGALSLLLPSALVGTIACGPPKAVDVPASGAAVEWVGRVETLPSGAVRLAWPAVQMRLRFEGTALRASIEDTPLPDDDEETDILAVEVDGEVRDKLPLKQGHRVYTLVEGLAPRPHTLVVAKRTEPSVGTVTVHGFYTDGGTKLVSPPPRRTRRIEVIGDSIAAGYGNEGTKPGCGWDPEEEDATRTFATVAARALDAEIVVQAWTGKGLLSNYWPNDHRLFPEYYGKILPGDAQSPAIAPGFVPHAIVMAVGTNDFIHGVPEKERFLLAYRDLLERARRAAPAAHLFLVVSPMLTEEYPVPRAHSTAMGWLAAFRDELVASGAHATVVEQQWAKDEPQACGGHPSVKTHARLGAELAAVMHAELGW